MMNCLVSISPSHLLLYASLTRLVAVDNRQVTTKDEAAVLLLLLLFLPIPLQLSLRLPLLLPLLFVMIDQWQSKSE